MKFEMTICFDVGCFPPQVSVIMPLEHKALCALMLGKALEGLAGEMEKETLGLALRASGGNRVQTKGLG
jgi:hypothetical protein